MRNLSPIHPQSTAPRERVITIGRHEISDKGDAFVIAEIGHNHQGSLEKAKELFQSAHMAGAHAVKLQKRHNKTLFTRPFYDKPYENENSFGSTYGRHRQALEFGRREYAELADLAKKLKMEFMATAFDLRSVDFLIEFDLSAYKIASGDLKTIPLIRRVARLGKPVILSSGGGSMDEIRRACHEVLEVNPHLVLAALCGHISQSGARVESSYDHHAARRVPRCSYRPFRPLQWHRHGAGRLRARSSRL